MLNYFSNFKFLSRGLFLNIYHIDFLNIKKQIIFIIDREISIFYNNILPK